MAVSINWYSFLFARHVAEPMVWKKTYHLANGKISCKQGRFWRQKGLKEADGSYWSETQVNQCWHM